MKRLLSLFLFPFALTACESTVFSTAQDFTVNIKGTESAYCNLYTRDNRYALTAPGKTLIERDEEELTVDCSDSLSERRRVVTVESHFGLGYWNYPESVLVDFSTLENGTIKTGYRDTNGGLTEKSFSYPLDYKPKNLTVSQPYPMQQSEAETTIQTDTFESFIERDILMVDGVDNNFKGKSQITPFKLYVVDEEPPMQAAPGQVNGISNGRRSYPVQLD